MCLAVPGRVVSAWQADDLPMAEVDFDGVRKEICTVTLPDVVAGEWILVHAGFALQRIAGRDAEQLLAWLAESDASEAASSPPDDALRGGADSVRSRAERDA